MKTFLKKIPVRTLRISLIVIFGLYLLVGFVIIPYGVKSKLTSTMSELYGEAVKIESVQFNPFTFSLVIENFHLPNTKGQRANDYRLSFSKLTMNLDLIPLIMKKISFSEFTLEKGKIQFEFLKGGAHNFKTLTADSSSEKKATPTGSSPWILHLENLNLSDNEFHFRDQNYEKEVYIPMGPFTLTATDLSTKLSSESVLRELKVKLANGGELSIAGKMSLTPVKLLLNFRASKFPLKYISSYLSNTTTLDIVDGNLDFLGSFHYESAKLKISGKTSAKNFELKSPEGKFLSLKEIDLEEFTYLFPEHDFKTPEIRVQGLWTSVILNSNGKLNFSEIIKPQPSVEGESGKKEKGLTYEVGKLTLIDSGIYFADLQIKPNFKTDIKSFNGDLSPIESSGEKAMAISLEGQVEDFGKFKSQGNFHKIKRDLNLNANFSNIELTTFTPYAGKFAGHEIKKGKMFLDLTYTLKGDRIQGKNQVRLDHFKLGERVESKDAPSIPMGFVVSLLQDRKGQIKFKLPVEGTTKDPKFSVGSMIRTALFNMLLNIAMSPFDFLSDLLGLNKEMKHIYFENLTDKIKLEELSKFNDLKKLLDEKDELRLEVLGTVSKKELPEKISEEEMKNLYSDEVLITIGLNRARNIQKALVEKGIPAERVFIQAAKINDDSIGPSGGILQITSAR